MGESGKTSRFVTGLGVLSLALGIAQVVGPGPVGRLVGARPDAHTRAAQRWLGGARELTAGAAILTAPRPTGWLWARVAGDLFDLAMLANGSLTRDRPGARRRATVALASVAAVTIADVVAASRSLARRRITRRSGG